MQTTFEELESPYLDGELEFAVPTHEMSYGLDRVIGESPFANFVAEYRASQPTEGMEIFDEIEQDWINGESAEGRLQNSESGEAEQSIHRDDSIAADKASPLDHDYERRSIDYEFVREIEDEPAGEGSIRLEFEGARRGKAKQSTPPSSLPAACAQPSPWPDRKCSDSKPSPDIAQRRIRRLCEVIIDGIKTKEHDPRSAGGPGLFAGSYDWHSAVHAHWALLSIARVKSDHKIEAWLASRLTDKALRAEREFLKQNAKFELPYGRAWLLLLLSELARRSRIPKEVTALQEEMQESVLGWLERSAYPEAGTKAAPRFTAQHDSWLFAYMLFAMTNPKSDKVRDKLRALRKSKIEPARGSLAAAKYSDKDFLFLPAVQAVVDRVDSTAPATTEAYPVGPARALLDPPLNVGNAHGAGGALVRIWPHAIDMHAGDEKACSRYHALMNEMFSRTDHWADSFALVSHWVPQFMCMALWLAEGRP